MKPAYHYNLPSGTRIFRATTIDKEGRWYTLSLQDAYTYGENITEYSTTKDLNLLNIASLTFHNDFIDRLNIIYPDSKNSVPQYEKIKCLLPLGLADIHSQQIGTHLLNTNLPINESCWSSSHDYSSKILMNRHRLSDHRLDSQLVDILQKIYGEVYEGCISPFEWPTKIHGGYFPRELCLFKIQNIQEETTHKRPQTAGGTDQIRKVEFVPFNINFSDEFIKKIPSHNETLKLFWNPHTGEIPQSEKVQTNNSVQKRIRHITRKKIPK